jgi:hypothetical protein
VRKGKRKPRLPTPAQTEGCAPLFGDMFAQRYRARRLP